MSNFFRNLCFVIGCSSALLGVSQENLPPPYNTVNLLPFDAQGWFLNGKELEAIIKNNPIKVVIEVGSWVGLSTRFIASTLPEGGKVYAVDHWLGSIEHQPGNWAHNSALLPVLYDQFLSNVIHAGLTDKIVPIRMSSLVAVNYLRSLKVPVVPDLIYIDAGHDTASVYADLNAWYPYVQGHGFLCGDDWTWETVRAAVQQFAREKKLRIKASENFWCLLER